MTLTAGTAAQWVLLGRTANAQRRYIAKSDHDHVLAAKLLSSVTSDRGEINRLLRQTLDLLKRNAGAIDVIANQLLEQPTMTNREVGMTLGAMLVGCEPVMS